MGLSFHHSFPVTPFITLPPPQTKNISDPIKEKAPSLNSWNSFQADCYLQLPRVIFRKLLIKDPAVIL